jgi:flagellar motor switch protein FliN
MEGDEHARPHASNSILLGIDMLTPSQVLSAAKNGLVEASEAATRALEAPIKVAAQSASPFLPDLLGEVYSSAGLAIVLKTKIGGAVLVIPESAGLLPTWCATPNDTQTSQLATLAQEWGMTLWPDAAAPDDFNAAHVPNLREAISRGGIGPDAGAVSLSLTSGELTAPMLLIWPIEKPDEVLRQPSFGSPTKFFPSESVTPTATSYFGFDDGLSELPRYARSLLKVKVPVRVTLARSRQPIGRLLSLDQGSILNFAKSCDEPLQVEAGEECIAEGEVIRVGDRFGVRVTGMILPSEKFLALESEPKTEPLRK